MKYHLTHTIGICNVAFLMVMGVISLHGQERPSNTPQAPTQQSVQDQKDKEALKTLESFVLDESYIKKAPHERLVALLTVFFNDLSIKGHFSKFIEVLVALLEDKDNAAHIKSKYPSINIPAIVSVLKSIQNDKAAVQIVFKLKNYLQLFPEELKKLFPEEMMNMGVIAYKNQISKRLADK